MHKIPVRTFEKVEEQLQVRNQTEDLIAQIVNATSEKDKHKLAKEIKIAYHTLGWTDTDLHALLAKRKDPSIRNYTAFVKWSRQIKTCPKEKTSNVTRSV